MLCSTLLAAFVLGACGGDDDGDPASTGDESAETTSPEVDVSVPEKPEVPVTPNPVQAAGIDPASGFTQGIAPDVRPGTSTPEASPPPLPQAAGNAGCEVRLKLPDEGNSHLSKNDPAPTYKTSPPTSGDHDPVPVADGAHRKAPPETAVVHSLEHGRVAIHYSPSLPADQQLLLKGLFDEDPNGMLLIPDSDMPYDVAATAWRNLLGCGSFGAWPELKAALVAFRDQFRGRGPERLPL